MGVANRALDLGVAQVALDDAQIYAPLDQVITAGVAQHVGMDVETSQAGSGAQPLDHLVDSPGRQPSSPFGTEDELPRGWAVPFQLAQGADLDAAQGMVSADRTLQPVDMVNPMLEIEVLPAGLQCFQNPKSVAIADQDQGMIASRPAVAPGGFEEPVDFGIGEVLAVARAPGRWDEIFVAV